MKIKGKLVDIHSRRIYPALVIVESGRILEITEIEEAGSYFIMPGLIDAHVHIESSMVTPSRFAETAVKHGTIGVVSDPHEIANVAGISGVEFMIKDASRSPLYFWFGAPSCVPATVFETAGGKLGLDEVELLLKRNEIKYLSEMMNYPGVIHGDQLVKEKIRAAIEKGKSVDGHVPGVRGEALRKYVQAGISTDHECSTIEEALEKIDLGMKILVREGSAARNLDALKELIRSNPEMVMLCSDDLHPEMLEKRHINRLISRLVLEGYDPFDVLRSCTINPIKHYGLEAGLLRPGDSADFILVDDITRMNIAETWIKGEKVYEKGIPERYFSKSEVFNNFNSSAISTDDLRVISGGSFLKVITVFDGELVTGCELADSVKGEPVFADTSKDILKIVVKDRYKDKPPAVAFIKGFALRKGAFASSIAHDSHNIICVGADDKSIAGCINEIVRMKGGLCVSDGDKITSLCLSICGIMSDDPVEKIARNYEELSDMVREGGCKLSAPFMTLSFMALLVIPQLKLSDRGLFDGSKFALTDLFTDN